MNDFHGNEELLHIRKRARRRLVGAVALVFFALVVLWTVLDNTPPPQFSTGHSVEITSSAPALQSVASVVAVVQVAASAPEEVTSVPDTIQQSTATASVVSNNSPVATGTGQSSPDGNKTAVPDGSADTILPGKLVNKQTAVKVDAVANSKTKAEKKPVASPVVDPRKILEGRDEPRVEVAEVHKYFLQVGAFSDAAKSALLISKLKSAGLPAFSEKVKTSKGELTRIRVGPTTSDSRAQEWRKKSEALGVPGKVIKQ